MDILIINSYNRVIDDLRHDTGLEPELKEKMLLSLSHRVWELENWEQFYKIDEEN